MLNGILVIDKDAGMTSADVVYHLRKVLHIRKMGHAGTLDPEVTGVLPIAIGQATKLIELMHQQPKEYEGQGLFGLATDSYDLAGKVTQKKILTKAISKEQLQGAMSALSGPIVQLPPIYSAVKVKGKHLYDYARAGIPVKRPERKVNVFVYRLIGSPVFDAKKGQESFSFKIKCSKGTYVRTLVNDLGKQLGVPAVMTSLRRTASSGFSLREAVKLQTIEKRPELAEQLIQSIDAFFRSFPHLALTTEQWQQVKNGAWLPLATDAKKVALSYNKKVKAIYQRQGKLYRPYLMLLANQ